MPQPVESAPVSGPHTDYFADERRLERDAESYSLAREINERRARLEDPLRLRHARSF